MCDTWDSNIHGSHVEIFAIANNLRIPVFSCTVNQDNPPSYSIKWEVFKPLFPVSQLHYPVPITDDPCSDSCNFQPLTHIELLYGSSIINGPRSQTFLFSRHAIHAGVWSHKIIFAHVISNIIKVLYKPPILHQ